MGPVFGLAEMDVPAHATTGARAGLAGLGRPGERRGMDAGADRVAPGVGEPDPGDQPAGGAHRLFDDARIDVYEPQLGAAEHPQRPVAGHLAPGQAEMAVGAVTAHERPAAVVALLAAPH